MFSWQSGRLRPLIVGHRGASATAPENTMVAFRAAVHAGARAVELDVRLTADGEVVVLHDATLLRTTGVNRPVRDLRWNDIRLLDAGGWFGPRFAGERIPLLAEVVEGLPRSIGINVEVKHAGRRGEAKELIERCAEIIGNAGAQQRVLISSFQIPYLRLARKLLPETPRGLLFHTLLHAGHHPLTLMRRLDAEFLILYHRTVRKRLVQEASEAGFQTAEYAIDTVPMLSRSVRFGLDAVITNDPEFIVRKLPLAR